MLQFSSPVSGLIPELSHVKRISNWALYKTLPSHSSVRLRMLIEPVPLKYYSLKHTIQNIPLNVVFTFVTLFSLPYARTEFRIINIYHSYLLS